MEDRIWCGLLKEILHASHSDRDRHWRAAHVGRHSRRAVCPHESRRPHELRAVGRLLADLYTEAPDPIDDWARTVDGKRLTVVLAIVDDTGITVEPKTRVPEEPRHIPFAALQQVELAQSGASTGKAVAIGVGVGVASFFGIMLVMLAALGD